MCCGPGGLEENASLCLFSCVHSMRLARVSFLSCAIDGRLLRFQPGFASRSGSLRFVATSRSANTLMRQVTVKLAHQLADGTADRCAAIPVFSAETEIAQKDTFGALRRQCYSFPTSHRKRSAALQCPGRGRNAPKAHQGKGVGPARESLLFHAHRFDLQTRRQIVVREVEHQKSREQQAHRANGSPRAALARPNTLPGKSVSSPTSSSPEQNRVRSGQPR